ncbi:MAG: phenylacetic acid degradation protein PaaN [Bacteroidetes bacterium]|nr:phenylacetic acid degradation protein PaaN [Bacteroidota bacterium]
MSYFQKHKESILNAAKANAERTFYAAYPEHPKAYAPDANDVGMEAYKNQLGNKFSQLLQGETASWGGEENSPYTREDLGISYPLYTSEELVANAKAAKKAWANVSPEERAGILVESLERVKDRFFEIGYATMHTTGQSFIMSFQASGPHANDRAMEAIAMGYEEQQRFPNQVTWVKPMGKFDITLQKEFKAVPKGVALVIGCSTFPTWNTVPGLYASLVTGNPTIVKPHPKSVLPIAIVVAEIQNVLKEAGLDTNICQLGADVSENLITKELSEHKDVKLIDYTGGSAFGNYIESLTSKTVFTEKAGVNSCIIDSVADMNAVMQNIGFSISLYSGQMCTAPQNFFVPEGGIESADGHISFDEVVEHFKKAVVGIAQHPKMGVGVYGAIQNDITLERLKGSGSIGATVAQETMTVDSPEFENARVGSPAVLVVDGNNVETYEQELFGPIVFIIKTKNTADSVAKAKEMGEKHGAITCLAYTTNAETKAMIKEEMEEVFVPVSFNLVGGIFVNQHAAFSDFHVTGGNPAGNASFTNPEYINKRFVWVGHREI